MWLRFVKCIIILLLIISYDLYNVKESSLSNLNNENYVKNEMPEMVYSNENIELKNEKNKEKPIATITISKINLNRPLYSIDSNLNNVNKNIEILKGSNMPSDDKSNLILASHSGYSSISYFHNLYKLDINDEIVINYNAVNYTYKVSKIYEVLKTGKVSIKRDKNKKTITMITCKDNDKQLVVIGYLV